MTLALMMSAVIFSNRNNKYDPAAEEGQKWYQQAAVSLDDILFIMSHWVFVYYYLKVAFTVPVYFQSMAMSKKCAEEKIARVRRLLIICSVSFIILTAVLYGLQALYFEHSILVIIFLTLPLIVVSMMMIYAILRIQEEIRHIGVDTY